ncbi:hypothetical protein GYO_2101 [Bacillus spizizenii TU-B-10]|uniref:Uncharacterized protein n=1 Tax=Bacillus spizizenii (strain DSM 15029 / JCM 12233 / NBRC 101239 / NRRL B-23049 / TU-B-10) TaxID=1052585 RepID=G4NVQ3_BACS4|nr:hypothetical protein GYO_2101 [Bacillus spizizenii TU-B-10]
MFLYVTARSNIFTSLFSLYDIQADAVCDKRLSCVETIAFFGNDKEFCAFPRNTLFLIVFTDMGWTNQEILFLTIL